MRRRRRARGRRERCSMPRPAGALPRHHPGSHRKVPMRPDLAEGSVRTMSNLLTLDAATDASVCGHKAVTLAALRSLGFEVPDGFVIPAGVPVVRAEVAAALARLGDGPVVVRSSD